MGDFRNLAVWRRAHALALRCYTAGAAFPFAERFGLAAQLRRSAVSVVSNIAEGAGRGRDREFRAFRAIARGSLHELEAQLLLARDLGFIGGEVAGGLEGEIHEVSRMLTGLTDHLVRSGASQKACGPTPRFRKTGPLPPVRDS